MNRKKISKLWTKLVINYVHFFESITTKLGLNINLRVVDTCLGVAKN